MLLTRVVLRSDRMGWGLGGLGLGEVLGLGWNARVGFRILEDSSDLYGFSWLFTGFKDCQPLE